MKSFEVNDDTHAALERLAASRSLTIDALLASMLRERTDPSPAASLDAVIAGTEFGRVADPVDRYLAVLAWCASNHAADFADFVSHQPSALRYLWLDRGEFQEIRARNQTRQIAGTQFWAITSIGPVTKGRFVRRLLVFVGVGDETVVRALRALDLPDEPEWFRLPGVA